MKYISKVGDETNKKLIELRIKITDCETATVKLCEKHGWNPRVIIPSFTVAGGIGGVLFDKPIVNWRMVAKIGGSKFYLPSKRSKVGKILMEEIEALPSIKNWDYNEIIGSDSPLGRFGLMEGPDGSFLLDISESTMFEAKDLEEITNKEYQELKEEAISSKPIPLYF